MHDTPRGGLDPTPFADLNALLAELTTAPSRFSATASSAPTRKDRSRSATPTSTATADFLIPVARPVNADQEAAPRATHDEFPTRREHWARHLEGSYPHADELRTLVGLGRPWLYVDHGWRAMGRSTHCNTAIVRWTLREHGRALAGPHPGRSAPWPPSSTRSARTCCAPPHAPPPPGYCPACPRGPHSRSPGYSGTR
ncbi:MAG: hypothetical protein HKP61_02475 [Dactylosporangium sp.]|nr:hypothetical protein [Dactylosporangium sp.]NNJ59827.1 hypothetical protein [Dactylosporangium sp.]